MRPSTPLQQARYWQRPEKFTGLNGTWLGYVNELIKETKYQLENTKEQTMVYKVRERAMKFLQLIYNLRIQDRYDFANNERLLDYVKIISAKPLMKKRARNPQDPNASTTEVDTDIEVHDEDEPGDHWIRDKPFRLVAEYLQNIVESSTDGPAHDVLQNLGFDRDRNGYQSLKRLCEVFGRSAQHTACIPQNFIWGTNSLHSDWARYKNIIDGGLYLATHTTNGPIVVSCAKNGFLAY